jgi:peptidoglycan/LPS O-acetylase OafA/YrhL
MVRGAVARQISDVQAGARNTERSLTYLPWMDGMRAIAVLAVMVYHEMLSQPGLGIQRHFSGGLLGVDVFFAISGFLITALLLQEARARGGIRFGAFYLRRARRLLPALGALLVVILVVAIVGQHGHHRTRTFEHVGITVAYAGNWAQAFDKSGMQELGQTWSLAIEEQFYLVWPAILTVLLIVARKRVVAGVFALTVASVAWLEFAAHRHWSFDRVYYGLDTRAASLAFGALLGALFVTGALPTGRVVRAVRAISAAAGVVLIGLLFRNAGWLVTLVNNHGMGRLREYAKDSIFGLVALATALVIWELVDSAPHLGHRLLSWGPLVYLGRISYGLYLWDGTMTVWLTKDTIGVDRWSLVVVRTVVTLVIATLSWFIVEKRFRARKPGPAPAGSPVPGG